MNNAKRVWISLMTLAAASMSLSEISAASTDEEQAVRNSVSHFYAALNAMFEGDVDLMKEVWSHADDVTFMGPGGQYHSGWAQVEKDWEETAAMKLGGNVEPAHIQITMGKDIAVVNNFEKGENTDAKGLSQAVSIRATSVFRMEGGHWKMIGHHTDLLPYLAK